MYFYGEISKLFLRMKIPKAPMNNLFVTIEKKFMDTVTFDSGVTLYKDTGFHPEEAAMLKAKVVSVPRAVQQREDYAGFRELPWIGATILMRYDVVFRYKDQPDRDTPIYKNMFVYEGQEYWKVDIQQVLGIFEAGDGDLYGWNDYVICEPLEQNISYGNLIVPAHYAKVADNSRYRLLTRQLKHGLDAGTIIEVRSGIAQNYSIDTFNFSVINYQRILAAL